MNKRWLGVAFIAATMIFSLIVFNQLPAQVATHFNARGQPDGWSSRAFASFLLPLIAVGLVFVLNTLPRILPRHENFQQFENTYWLMCNLVIGLLCALHVVVLGRSLGWPISIPTAVLLAVGIMFTVIGNLLPRTRSNWLMGIRTPWTLESEYVWRETHRLGGRTFTLGGLITIVAAFLPARLQPWIAMAALAIAGFVPVVYSYVVWRREKTLKTEV
jgi:uncharacterized membrane protein